MKNKQKNMEMNETERKETKKNGSGTLDGKYLCN